MAKASPTRPTAHRASPTGPRGTRRWLFRLLAGAGAVAIALAVGEAAVRVLGVGPQLLAVSSGASRLSPNPLIRYEYLPGAAVGGIRINADGMRDRPRAVRKPAGTFRIACIGDSICAGFHTGHAEIFAARLERLLNRHYASTGVTFEVLNFGVIGYNITQIMEAFRVRGLKYQPDLIVYAYCINDVEDYSYEFECLRARVTAAKQNYFDSVRQSGAALARWSRLYALWRYSRESGTMAGQRRTRTRPDLQFKALADNTYATYFRAHYASQVGWGRVNAGLDRLAELANELDAAAYVAIFPVLRDLEEYPLDDVHQAVAAAARERSLSVVDLFDDYRWFIGQTGREARLDDLHPDSTGHAVAAVAILRALLADRQIPGSSPGLGPIAAGDQPEAWIAQVIAERGDQDVPTGAP